MDGVSWEGSDFMRDVSGDHRFLAIEGRATTADEAIRLCGDALERAGCVRESFAQDCVERELSYPTGLPTEVPVALPHCQSDAIVQSALCYLRLAEPVRFVRMDDEEASILTRHVFNLAIRPGNHLDFLSNVILMLQRSEVLRQLEDMDIDSVTGFLMAQLG